jgi:PKD repeat protein
MKNLVITTLLLIALFSGLMVNASFAGGLIYSTFLGGSGYDYAQAMVIDYSGNAYITGYTNSANFPTKTGAYDTTYNGNYDVFVSKLNATGSALLYSTYLGGSGSDYGYGITVDNVGNAYITGYTNSATDFPTTSGAVDTSYNSGSYDVFVSKLNTTGSALLYSTYLGGSGSDYGYGIVVGIFGNAYITGYTDSSTNFPTTPGVISTLYNGGSYDAFISKVNTSGSALNYSTYLGGSGSDYGYGIAAPFAVDSMEYAYITGYTNSSTNFPTTLGAIDTSYNGGSYDAFVSKLNWAGSALVYSTYLGGNGDDQGHAIVIDTAANGYITGYTGSANFPTNQVDTTTYPYIPGAMDNTYNGGSYDVFVSKLNGAGSALVYSTYLGGSGDDQGYAIAIDSTGNAYITGNTGSANFPLTSGGFDSTYNSGSYDVFVSKLNGTGSALLYSTYLGGSSIDYGYGIAVDTAENAYITGFTMCTTISSDFPTTFGAVNTTFNGGFYDAFISKIASNTPPIANFYGTPTISTVSLPVQFYDTSFGEYPASSWFWTFGDGSTSNLQNPAHIYLNYGIFTVTLVASNSYGSSTATKPNYILVYPADKPYADFYGSPTSGFAPLSVRFYDTSTVGLPTSWLWSFGDGDTSMVRNPTHTYWRLENHSVTLIISNSFGTTTATKTNYITVSVNSNANIGQGLLYSTYLGGNGDESGYSIAADGSGNAYVTGGTGSSNFPTTLGAFDTTYNGGDIFVTKINADGSALLYTTFLGGGGGETGNGITVDGSGNAYITGATWSNDFPTTPGAYDTINNGGDVFVSKLNTDGTALVYSTYLGGGSWDNGIGIAIDSSGNAYITGATWSTDFPTTPGAYDTTYNGGGGEDVFMCKLNADGIGLVYSTYLPFGSSHAIAVDGSGNAYITGANASNCFVTKLNPSGTAAVYSTNLGNGSGEAIAVDTAGNAYITGQTTPFSNFPTTPGAFDTTFDCRSAAGFVTKLNASGTAMVYSTCLGGGGDQFGSSIALDRFGNAYITGYTTSTNFPVTIGAYDISPYSARTDVFVSVLNATGSSMLYSTYIGGDNYEGSRGIAVDNAGIVYVTGETHSTEFPTTVGAIDNTFNGGYFDAFVFKLDPAPKIGKVSYSDVNLNNLVDQGDILTVQFPRPMKVNSSNISSFYLPIIGDSFGTGATVSLNTILNTQVLIILGSSPNLTIADTFSMSSISTANSSSGLDISASMAAGAIEDINGLDARDGGIRGINDSGLDIKYTLQPTTTYIPFKSMLAYSEVTIQVQDDSFNSTYTKHKLIIPTGTNKNPGNITIGKPGNNQGRSSAVALSGPAGITFSSSTPATLVVQYFTEDINTSAGFVSASMRVHQWNPNTQQYEPIPETLGVQVVDTTEGTVSVKIDKFDMLGVAGGNTTIVYANIALPTVGATTAPVAPATLKKFADSETESFFASTSVAISVTTTGIYTKHKLTLTDYTTAPTGIVVTLSQPNLLETQSWPPDRSLAPNNAIMKIKVTGGVVTTQAILTMEYKDRNDPNGKYTNDVRGGDESQMRIFRWINGGWSKITGTQTVNRIDNTVTVTVASITTSERYGVALDVSESVVLTPLADYVADKTSGTLPLPIQFTDISAGNPTSWSWSFGDGTTSSTQSPSHTYYYPGTYTVTLIISNSYGVSTMTKTNYISVGQIPIANFSANSTAGYTPLTIQFNDTSSGAPTGWSWSFGDGTTSSIQSPSHTYYYPGTYTVTLIASNSFGVSTMTKSNYISVGLAQKPIADFYGTPTTGPVSLIVYFHDISSGGTPTSWNWLYGDGGSLYDSDPNPNHTYNTVGSYTVTLIASNSFGTTTATKNNYIVTQSTTTTPSYLNTYGTFSVASDTTHWLFEVYADGTSFTGTNYKGTIIWANTFMSQTGVIALSQDSGQKGKLTQIITVPSPGWYTARVRVATDIPTPSKQQKVYLYLYDYANDYSITACGNTIIQPGKGGFGSASTWRDLKISFYAANTLLGVQVVGINQVATGVTGRLYIDDIWVTAGAPQPTGAVTINNANFDSNISNWLVERYADGTGSGTWSWLSNVNGRTGIAQGSQAGGEKGKLSQVANLPFAQHDAIGSLWVYSGAGAMANTQKVYLYIYSYDNSGYSNIQESGNAILQPGKWAQGTWRELKFGYSPLTNYNYIQMVGINKPGQPTQSIYFDAVSVKQD